MKRVFLFLSSCLLGITCSSCGEEIDQLPNSFPIQFLAQSPDAEAWLSSTPTKGALITNSPSNFGIFTYYTEMAYTPATAIDYMVNTKVTKTSGGWAYSPTMFWPNNGFLTFFAYSPYANVDDPYLQITQDDLVSGLPIFQYEVPQAVKEQRDLLASTPIYNQTFASCDANGKLLIPLYHTLSCITFYGRMKKTTSYPIKIQRIEMLGLKNKAQSKFLQDKIVWEFTPESQIANYNFATGEELVDYSFFADVEPHKVTSEEGNLLTIPQTLSESTVVKFYLDFYENGLPTPTSSDILQVNLKDVITHFEQGKRYNLTAVISPKVETASITLTCQVADWNEEIINVPDFN